MAEELASQAREVAELKSEAQRKLQAVTTNVAELKARLVRLDALGEHLTQSAGLDDGEFDFSQLPALGGPLTDTLPAEFRIDDVADDLASFEQRLANREQQLDILQHLLKNRAVEDQSWLSGRPVSWGWVSSPYGKRTDPFTGKPAVHKGVDIAGRAGSDILAVASGVVTWTGERGGYGNMVEITHSDGYVTRYGHNRENLVRAGDLVKKGETIALMGSTGRSTGAHVHYEVYKHGRPVDPSSYLRRTRR
jgi:murein DD-endopeptidase MepM/ murein hydrolase activator NlpD